MTDRSERVAKALAVADEYCEPNEWPDECGPPDLHRYRALAAAALVEIDADATCERCGCTENVYDATADMLVPHECFKHPRFRNFPEIQKWTPEQHG